MAADAQPAAIGQGAVGEHAEHREGVASPGGNIDHAVGGNLHRQRIVIGREALHDLRRREIDDGDAVADVLRDVEEVPARRHGDAGRVAAAGLVRSFRRQHDAALERRDTVRPGVAMDHVVVAAGDVELAPVAREREAVEGRVLLQGLRDPARRQVDDLDALLAPAAQHHHRLAAARRERQPQRHAPEIHHVSRGIEAQAGRQGLGRLRLRRRPRAQDGARRERPHPADRGRPDRIQGAAGGRRCLPGRGQQQRHEEAGRATADARRSAHRGLLPGPRLIAASTSTAPS
jgi:hypothetical protein